MTFFQVEDYRLSRGRCARCRKIAFREAPDYYCPKCRKWAAEDVGPMPLAQEIAEPFMLQDPGVDLDDAEDPREMADVILDALDTPGIRESLEFVAQHRNHRCAFYDGCLNIAIFQHWYFFSCASCKFFVDIPPRP